MSARPWALRWSNSSREPGVELKVLKGGHARALARAWWQAAVVCLEWNRHRAHGAGAWEPMASHAARWPSLRVALQCKTSTMAMLCFFQNANLACVVNAL
jgi:hypothetical protein